MAQEREPRRDTVDSDLKRGREEPREIRQLRCTRKSPRVEGVVQRSAEGPLKYS